MFDKVKTDIGKVVATYKGLGVVATLFSFFQGRATAFAILFATEGVFLLGAGLWGFFHGKDLTSLSSLVSSLAVLDGAIFTGVVGHSIKEDYFARRDRADKQDS